MRLQIRVSAVLALIVTLLAPGSLRARVWTDLSGQHHREAEYLEQRDGQVWLSGAGGKTYKVALGKLSDADRAYVESLETSTATVSTTGMPTLGAQAKTLSYRMLRADISQAGGSETPAAPSSGADSAQATLTRLTGWHCHSWHHCCPTVDCCPVPCPTPCPPNPCPPVVDKGKRILKGWHSTFHLVTQDPKLPGGTGAYKFRDPDGCCYTYLELLRFKSGNIQTDCVYEVLSPVLKITHWHFVRIRMAPLWYSASYSTDGGKTWVHYDTCCGKKPK